MLTGVYAITDPRLLPGDRLRRGVELALAGGARIIQYRDKQSGDAERLSHAQWLRDCCRAHHGVFIVNDDLALALRVGADGVHLGRTDLDIARARTQVPPDFLIGATCHDDLDYAGRVARDASYLAFGRFFPSHTKPEAPAARLSVLADAKSRLPGVPLVAIGGINADNARDVIIAGAHMIAVVDAIFGQPDIGAAAASLAQLFAEPQEKH